MAPSPPPPKPKASIRNSSPSPSRKTAALVTNDFNLNKIAQLRGVAVININDIADTLKPVVLPGENMTVRIVKPGEDPCQGVGYLEDGTMVVVEGAPDKIGTEVELIVTNALQTAAGKMIFGRTDGGGHAPPPTAPPAEPPTKREPRICIDDGRLSMTTIDSDLPVSVAVTTSGRCRSMRGCPNATRSSRNPWQWISGWPIRFLLLPSEGVF